MKSKDGIFSMTKDLIADIWHNRPGRELHGIIREVFRAKICKGKDVPMPKLMSYTEHNDNYFVLVYDLPPDLCVDDVLKIQNYLNSHVGGKVKVEEHGKTIYLDIRIGKIPQEVKYSFDIYGNKDKYIPFPVGVNQTGTLIKDLVDEMNILVGGPIKTGKSTALHGLAASCLLNKRVRLAAIDMALLELEYLKEYTPVFGYTLAQAFEILNFLEKLMYQRFKILASHKVLKIEEFYKLKGETKATDIMPFVVLLIDEFSALCPDYAKDKEEKVLRSLCHKHMIELSARGRKAGIHLVVATQRPDQKVVSGDIKANFPSRMCFKTADRVNSGIILDSEEAAYLPNIKGRAIWKSGLEVEEVQVMKISPKGVHQLLRGVPVPNFTGFNRKCLPIK